ncbi:MAG: hypothetical protein ACLGSD_13875 [Acidobacteriota bacterium]
MRKELQTVPVQVRIGSVPAALADEIVAAGHGLSLKGRAVLPARSCLERLLAHDRFELDPQTMVPILRAAARLDAERAAAAQTANSADDGEKEL